MPDDMTKRFKMLEKESTQMIQGASEENNINSQELEAFNASKIDLNNTKNSLVPLMDTVANPLDLCFESPKSSNFELTDLSEIKMSDNPILVVDDDNFNILALTGLLSQFNLVPDVAHNGKTAIDYVAARLAEVGTRPFY